jgi:hypothetical protein
VTLHSSIGHSELSDEPVEPEANVKATEELTVRRSDRLREKANTNPYAKDHYVHAVYHETNSKEEFNKKDMALFLITHGCVQDMHRSAEFAMSAEEDVINVERVPTNDNVADTLTKPLLKVKFNKFCNVLTVEIEE